MAQNQNYTGEKKHGKKKLLLLLLFGFLGLGGLGGGTVGVLYGVGVFKPNAITKITLSKAFFDNESTTTLTLTTPYAINDTVNEKTILSSLAGWINQAGRQAYYFENQLTVSNIGTSPGDNTALLKTKTNSVNYSSSTLTIAYQIVQQRNLTADLNQLSMPIDRQNN
jgi:hypothetical protein